LLLQLSCHAGDWCVDMKHGQGRSVYPTGNIYTGSWEHDLRQGHGCMQWISSGQCYTGGWLQGLPDGFGEHLWEQQQPAAGVQGVNHAMHVMHNRCVQHCCRQYMSWFAVVLRFWPATFQSKRDTSLQQMLTAQVILYAVIHGSSTAADQVCSPSQMPSRCPETM